MSKFPLRMRAACVLTFAITLTALLIQPMTLQVTTAISPDVESSFGVSTLAKTGESIGVILPKNPEAVHHYVLEPTQADLHQKTATFTIDEKTGEVRLKIEPASWEKETYLLYVDLLSQKRERIALTIVSIYKKTDH